MQIAKAFMLKLWNNYRVLIFAPFIIILILVLRGIIKRKEIKPPQQIVIEVPVKIYSDGNQKIIKQLDSVYFVKRDSIISLPHDRKQSLLDSLYNLSR
jgi:hypothetical protein